MVKESGFGDGGGSSISMTKDMLVECIVVVLNYSEHNFESRW
jgi:hypothetical protein